ncbi:MULTISPECIES: hypothetical protein [Bacillus]|nr:hypothetical protein [Bacillus thuringiensis]
MEFLFELLKKFVKAVVGEASAYVLRKSPPPTPRRCRKQKGEFRKK